MSRAIRIPRLKFLATVLSAVVLSGCASVNFEDALATTNQDAADFTQGQLARNMMQLRRAKIWCGSSV